MAQLLLKLKDIDKDYMQDKLDRLLRQIYGDAEFVPFEGRYPAIKQKKIK